MLISHGDSRQQSLNIRSRLTSTKTHYILYGDCGINIFVSLWKIPFSSSLSLSIKVILIW